jgi:hypothetical protein
MALPSAPRPLGFIEWIYVQDDARHFGPVRTFRVGIKQAQIGHEMFFVISGQIAGRGGLIGNRGIERWLGHNQARLYLPTPRLFTHTELGRVEGSLEQA